jgi:hypothetical protein
VLEGVQEQVGEEQRAIFGRDGDLRSRRRCLRG